MNSSHQHLDVIVVGTGFGGLGMAIKLKEAGITSFMVLEKAATVGGTWRDNSYPGAACDIESRLYSYSFEPKHDWSRKFSPQQEIQEYLQACATTYGLEPYIRFNTEVTVARFDEEAAQWVVSLADGTALRANVVVSAVGQLNRPAFPWIEGMETFSGTAFHSARWDHAHDLTGKSVAVVGTGASAIQFVPEIVPKVARLYLFQRSAAWVIPKPDRPFSQTEQRLFARSTTIDRLYRASIYWRYESRAIAFTRLTGLLVFFEWLGRFQIRRQVADPAKRRALVPDYPIGCKRVLISNTYYPALDKPHVEVVTDALTRVEGNTLVTADGRRRTVDTVIYGTGFHATEFLSPIHITGLHGRDLEREWRDGAEAYKGVSVAGFPNLFLIYGPNTNLGHNSIITMIEAQVDYVMQCLEVLRAPGMQTMDVRADKQLRYNDGIRERLRDTIWEQGCTSWYRTAAGKNTNNWPSFTVDYRRVMGTLTLGDYVLSPAAAAAEVRVPVRAAPGGVGAALVRGLLSGAVRLALRPGLSPAFPPVVQRLWMTAATKTSLGPRGARAVPCSMDGVASRHIIPRTARAGRAILYLHGGGYVAGSPASHAALAAHTGRSAGAEVWAPDYRLAPEHPYPAALDDVLRAYRWLLGQGYTPAQVGIVGDSAGGGLALALVLALREAGEPLPAALGLLSPWVDLTLSGDSMRTRALRDPMLRPAWLAWCAEAYGAAQVASHPHLSPLFADLKGLPPLLIHVGTEEILYSDATRLEERARAAGVDVHLRSFEHAWHDFQFHAGLLPQADASLRELGAFLRGHLDAQTAVPARSSVAASAGTAAPAALVFGPTTSSL